jgi:hypothetical protein
MARTIPAAAQTQLDTKLGTEINVILQVYWGGSTSGPSEFYADREIPGTQVKGKILSSNPVDEVVQVTGGGQSRSFSCTLDDTEGDIKGVLDANDVHKIPAQVWLYLTGTDFNTEKIPLFLGQINSPVKWREGQRNVDLTVVTRIEDAEVGFSAEEGEFPQLPEDLIGKTWPLCFGTTINVPALRAVPAVSGTLAGGVGIRDFTLQNRLTLAEAITCGQTPIGFKCYTRSAGITYDAVCNIAFETDQGCLQAKCVEEEKLKLQIQEQAEYEYNNITIFGGKQFPQGRTITLNIQGGLFRGEFQGTSTNPTNVFSISSRTHPDYDPSTGGVVKDDFQAQIESACPGQASDNDDSDFQETAFGPVFTGLRSSRLSWEAYRDADQASFFWAPGGATVVMQDRQEIVYVANIVPSTIYRVAAFRNINGNRFLLTVPDEFYTIRQTDFNGYNVMEIVFERPLSSQQQKQGGGWSDEIFITQKSTVGPNTVDILEWFINTYTDFAIDSTSFNDVKTKIDNYPMHFPLLSRPNIITVLKELATQARCALWLKQDTFYIKYLAEEPTAVATITEDDVLADDATQLGTLVLDHTKTEALVTKLTCNWRKDHRTDWEDNLLILRHNVKKYGTHASKQDYYSYAHLDLVRKSSTFWLIRKANTWKRVSMAVPLSFLKLEPFDAVNITLPDIANGTVLSVVEKAALDPNGKQINLELWTPVRAGEMDPYDFAFPAYIAETALFPSKDARDASQAGSGNEPNFSVMAPPGHPLETNTQGVYTGMQLGCNGAGVTSLKPGECRQDHGDRNPSDTGDQKPTVDVAADNTGKINTGTAAVSNGDGSGLWSLYNWLANQGGKAEEDAGRGREYGAMNDSNNEGDGHGTGDQSSEDPVTRDFLDSLPDPDDVQGACQITVTVSGFGTSESGTRPICLPQAIREEIYVFDQRAAADDFCNNLQSNNRCGSEAPCTQCVVCGVSGTCAAEDEGQGALIGFRGAPGFEHTSFMQGSD